jgi:ankyrin repeat protein
LNNGANVKARLEDGRTALHRATGNGHSAVVQLLLNNEADVKAKDRVEQTTLHTGQRSTEMRRQYDLC